MAPIMSRGTFTFCVSFVLSLFFVVTLAFNSYRAPVQSLDDLKSLGPRADPNLQGYLGTFFLGNDPFVYFYLSNGNNALSLRALNRGQPVLRPTKGTGGVRDPSIISGGGAEAGKKWYIIGTDLHIGKVSRPAVREISV